MVLGKVSLQPNPILLRSSEAEIVLSLFQHLTRERGFCSCMPVSHWIPIAENGGRQTKILEKGDTEHGGRNPKGLRESQLDVPLEPSQRWHHLQTG